MLVEPDGRRCPAWRCPCAKADELPVCGDCWALVSDDARQDVLATLEERHEAAARLQSAPAGPVSDRLASAYDDAFLSHAEAEWRVILEADEARRALRDAVLGEREPHEQRSAMQSRDEAAAGGKGKRDQVSGAEAEPR